MLTRMRQRIIIQTSTATSSTGGTFTETWADTYTRFANVKVKNATENFRFDKDSQENTYEITMRSEDFTNKMRLKYGTKILRIESVSDPTQYNRMIKVIANEELT
jgi:SPP1 family predicted phage head-tail adaptor